MIIVDTSIWIDHLRSNDAELARLLGRSIVLAHPFIIGEVALGHLKRRSAVIDALAGLPSANVATDLEVLLLIESANLIGTGVGYLDAHLLAAAKLSSALLWTRDKRLALAAERLHLTYGAG
jgi:predicted nucleic acid-binding protein